MSEAKFKVGDRVKYNCGIENVDQEWDDCIVTKDIDWAFEVERTSDGQSGTFRKGWILPYIEEKILEPKFKLGDVIRWVSSGTAHWQNAKITKVDIKNKQYNVDDAFDGSGAFCFSWDLELVKAAEPEIELDSLWIHNKFGLIVKVLLIGVDGRIALVAQNAVEGEATEGEMFIYTQHYQAFTEAYKPYVPEPKIVKLEKWVCVEQYEDDKEVSIDASLYDTEELAKEGWESYGCYKLLGVAKIEWEGTVE